MERNILTWTKLCQRAKYLLDHRPEDYAALRESGTTRFLTGLHVRLLHSHRFEISQYSEQSGAGKTLAVFGGIRTKSGKVYTKVHPHLTPTNYKKRFWEKYMPVSFPMGLPRRGHTALAKFHSGGGTVSGHVTLTPYRNESARFSVCPGNPGWLLIRDDEERLVEMYDTRSHLSDPDGLIDHHRADHGSADFEPWSTLTADRTVNLRGSECDSRDKWLASILECCNQGLMDKHLVLPLAARMWNAAYLFCQEHGDKYARFWPVPMRKASNWPSGHDTPTPVLRWGECMNLETSLGETVLPRNRANAHRWSLPQICIEFQGGVAHNDSTHPFYYRDSLLEDRVIVMTLPPLGNPLMEERPEYSTPGSRLHESYACMRGEYTNQLALDPVMQPLQMCHDQVHRYVERAYHGIPILRPDCDYQVMRNAQSMHRTWHTPNVSWAEHDAQDHKNWDKWSDKPGCVHVVSDFDHACVDNSGLNGTWATYTSGRLGFAMTPEAAVNMVAEQWLLNSMPLS